MASSIDRSVVKRIVLELLEEDEEFRLAVAAKVGLLEILQKLEEHDRKFNEILERLDRNEKILLRHEEEIRKIWEKLEEHDRKFNEILAELREHRKILERHERMLVSLKRYAERHEKAIGSLGETLGVLAETILVDKVKEHVLEIVKASGEEAISIRHRYRVNKEYEIDLYIEATKTIYIIEVKTKPSVRYVRKLDRVRECIESRETRKVKPILVTLRARLTKEVVEEAEKHGINLILY